MNLRHVRGMLWATGSASLITAAVMLILSARWPYARTNVTSASLSSRHGGETQQAVDALPSISQLQAAARIPLDRPLYDPPPAVIVQAQPPAPPPLAIKLAGTIVEPGHSRALLVRPDGKTELKSVGQSCGEAEVLRIETDAVVLRYLGKEITLVVPKENTAK